jgi:hypothetical protein
MDEMKNTKELQEISFEVFNNPIRNSALSLIVLLKHRGRGDELYYFQLQGFVESSLQTYDAICDLVSKNRRKKYPAQATFLVRSIIDVFFQLLFYLMIYKYGLDGSNLLDTIKGSNIFIS